MHLLILEHKTFVIVRKGSQTKLSKQFYQMFNFKLIKTRNVKLKSMIDFQI